MVFSFLAGMVVLFGIINLLRIVLYMVGADWHDVGHEKKFNAARASIRRRPGITVVIPAHNEENVIIRAITSVYSNAYPLKEIIVLDDGSQDRTAELVLEWKNTYKATNLRLISQENQGKAVALNNAIAKAKGSLIMVLDADSVLHPAALENVIEYFKDPAVGLVASNVKIMDTDSPLKLAQKFEYLICYRMKRAQTAFNVEYIIGGIGSTFRRSMALEVGLYDTDTITEDIDFTMKVLSRGKKWKAIYAPRVITYTEPVAKFAQLIQQRFRWKYGRSQVFLKYRRMFFSMNSKYHKRLTLLALPYALYADIAFFFEPLLTGFILYLVIRYGDWSTLLSAYIVLTTYLLINLYAEETESWKTKIKLTPFAFLQYPLAFALSAAEYAALIKSLLKTRQLLTRVGGSSWTHVTRSGNRLNAEQMHQL
jgi:biofilm PGA synthesis N-glycosyltransferase PgaC